MSEVSPVGITYLRRMDIMTNLYIINSKGEKTVVDRRPVTEFTCGLLSKMQHHLSYSFLKGVESRGDESVMYLYPWDISGGLGRKTYEYIDEGLDNIRRAYKEQLGYDPIPQKMG